MSLSTLVCKVRVCAGEEREEGGREGGIREPLRVVGDWPYRYITSLASVFYSGKKNPLVHAFYTYASVCVYIVVVRDGMMKMKRVWVGGRSDGWMSEFGCHSNGTEFGWPM